ncbi:MAG: PilZ domain-containing protein [Gemmatimonadetes bacterium]|nr:PilZ domain-containing protein [Gemmatimonadota bacterium]
MRSNPRREFLRHTVDVPLEVERVGDSEPLTEQGINVSYGGLAFLSTVCPEVGEILRIRIPTVEPPFDGRARVAWCRPESGKFLVGVQFLDSAVAYQSRMVQQVCAIESYRKEIARREGRVLTTQDAAAEWIARYAGRFPDSQVIPGDDSATEPEG